MVLRESFTDLVEKPVKWKNNINGIAGVRDTQSGLLYNSNTYY